MQQLQLFFVFLLFDFSSAQGCSYFKCFVMLFHFVKKKCLQYLYYNIEEIMPQKVVDFPNHESSLPKQSKPLSDLGFLPHYSKKLEFVWNSQKIVFPEVRI